MAVEGSPDWERWRGQVDARLTNHDSRIGDIGEDIKEIKITLGQVLESAASIQTKVGMWAAIGGLIGTGLVAAVVSLLTRHF